MTPPPMDRLAAPETAFRHETPVFFDELDAMGMLHNARYALIVERATSAFFESHGWRFSADPKDNPDQFHVVREFAITFHTPVRGTARVTAHLWTEQVGSASAIWGFAITSADGALLHASGRRVIVKLDHRSLRPAPWTPRCAAVLSDLIANAPSVEASGAPGLGVAEGTGG